MEPIETTKVHLVLSAGGVKVLSYIGALSVLAERNISFASVSACSAGSFIGALLSAGKTPEEIENWILDIDLSSYLGKRAPPSPLGFYPCGNGHMPSTNSPDFRTCFVGSSRVTPNSRIERSPSPQPVWI